METKRTLQQWLQSENYLLHYLKQRDDVILACVDLASSDIRTKETVIVPKDVSVTEADLKAYRKQLLKGFDREI